MQRTLILTLFITTWLFALPVYANKGIRGGQFLNIQPGARAVAMGGAFTGLADDINAIYWNPSGLGFVTIPQAIALYNSWFEGINYEYLSCVKPNRALNGALGLSLALLQIDDLEKRTSNTELPISIFKANDMSLSMGYGMRFNNSFSVGANLRYLQSQLESNKGTAITLDAGSLINILVEELTLGINIQNLLNSGIRIKNEKDELTVATKIGLGYKMINGNISADYSFSNDNERYFCLGAEYWINKILAIRAGYKSDIGFRYGFGMKINPFDLDYAYATYGDLGDTHQISFSMRFEQPFDNKTITKVTPLPEIESLPKKEITTKVSSNQIEEMKKDNLLPSQRLEIIESPMGKKPFYVVTTKNLQIASYIPKNSDPNLVQVYIQLKNINQRETFYTNINFFTLVTDSGRKIQYSARTFGEVAYFRSKDLPPQGESDGSLLFEVPCTEKAVKLLYQDIQENFVVSEISL